MKSIQPKFELVKTAFYQFAVNSAEANFSVLMETVVQQKLLPYFPNRKEEFKQDLNNWLNGIDIRTVGKLIDVVIENGGSLPKWIAKKQFVIDYNKNEALDLIKIDNL